MIENRSQGIAVVAREGKLRRIHPLVAVFKYDRAER